jgi:hypothetical protein
MIDDQTEKGAQKSEKEKGGYAGIRGKQKTPEGI